MEQCDAHLWTRNRPRLVLAGLALLSGKARLRNTRGAYNLYRCQEFPGPARASKIYRLHSDGYVNGNKQG